jgi:hypothetical protein
MKKPLSLEKKIKAYSAIATGLLAISATAQGQIIYHDVNPDVTLTGNDSLDLDINNDGILDFTLYQFHYQSGTSFGDGNMIIPKDINNVLTSDTYLKLLNNNERISENDTVWGNNGTFLGKGFYSGSAFEYGNWKGGITDKFAGFRFSKNGNWYYGWARFDVAADAKSITIKDWAYNSYANSQIKASHEVSSIIDRDKNDGISVSLNNRTLTINQKEGISANINISIYNSAGQEIRKKNLINNQVEINLSDEVPGLYIMRIESEKGSSSHKIMLQ